MILNRGVQYMTARTARGVAGATLAAALITGVTACSAPAAGGSGADVVVEGTATEPETLGPLLGYGKGWQEIVKD